MTFERTTLPSGIRVVTAFVPGQRSVSLGAWVGTGSRDEAPPIAGATHFLEHLVFKGTETRSALRIAQDFDVIGGDLNAFTTKELTCFHARVLDEDVTLAFETIADMLCNATLRPDDVDSERNVILEEIAMHDDTPDDVVFDLFSETVWGLHPLGRRVVGSPDTVKEMSRDAIAAYYRSRYVPPAIVVAAAGSIEHERIVDLARRAFPQMQAEPQPREQAGLLPEVWGRLGALERDTEQMHLVYGTRGIARSDERRWALGVLNVALGGGMSSRLWQEIREKRGLVYNVSSGHQGYVETGLFSVYAGCSPDRAAEVMAIVRDEIDAIVADGISAEELARAAGHLRGSLLVSFDDSSALMSHLGKSELLQDEILTIEEMIARIESVDVDDVRRVAAEVLAPGPWTLAAVGPRPSEELERFAGAAS